MPQSRESSLNLLSNRKRIGRFTSRFLAATALLSSILPMPVEARTINHPRPLTFTEDDCSRQTQIPGQRPTFEHGNGNVTTRGYNFNKDTRSGEVKVTIADPKKEDILAVSTFDFDLVIKVNPEINLDKMQPVTPASIGMLWGFSADSTIDPFMRPRDTMSELELEEFLLNDAPSCTVINFRLNGGRTNIDINGELRGTSDAAF